MGEEIKTMLIWILGFMVSILSGVGSWVFKKIFDKLKELEDNQVKNETKVQQQFGEMKTELALNNERDKNNHNQILLMLADMKKDQEKMMNIVETWQKDINNFYYLNPGVKKPDA